MAPKKVETSICLIHPEKPASYNSSNKKPYMSRIAGNFQRHYKGQLPDADLYGLIYYFYKDDKKTDTDNISKPVWDALSGIALTDDRLIKIRSAASIDLSATDYMEIDLDTVSSDVMYDLVDSITGQDHTLYIETGKIESYKNLFNLTSLWK